MSGLCGCIHWTNRPGHAQAAAQMADAAAYRGPDGIEAWSGARASLTHLALNVTAADECESQPLVEGAPSASLVGQFPTVLTSPG